MTDGQTQLKNLLMSPLHFISSYRRMQEMTFFRRYPYLSQFFTVMVTKHHVKYSINLYLKGNSTVKTNRAQINVHTFNKLFPKNLGPNHFSKREIVRQSLANYSNFDAMLFFSVQTQIGPAAGM